MDKGLDITTLIEVVRWHAALSSRPRLLARVAHALPAASATIMSRASLAAHLAAAARTQQLSPGADIAERVTHWLAAPRHHVVTCIDPDYPPQLSEIPNPPLLLFVAGDPTVLQRTQFAIVGSRNASPSALAFAAQVAGDLANRGTVITSGLAYGVDSAAHRATVALGTPGVAVLGSGIDRIYPGAHRDLARALCDNGALVSEFPLGTPPRPQHFPRRNRIIAGLSVGTLVVEAASRSGSISTAMHALEQGREVFAVPGSVLNPLARGCHALLRAGARLTESVEDILDELPVLARMAESSAVGRTPAEASPPTDPRAHSVLAACDWTPVTIDQLVRRSGLTVQEVCSMLLPLELSGHVEAMNDGTYLRVR